MRAAETQIEPPEVLPDGAGLQSFFAAGFECSTFRRRSGRRMDFIAATQHHRFAQMDYARLKQLGIRVSREGVRWHLVEQRPGHYDFSSVQPIVRAARATATQVIWDLCHFGWPDHLDLFGPDFVSSLRRYGAAFARWLGSEMNGPAFFVPVNEISFFFFFFIRGSSTSRTTVASMRVLPAWQVFLT